MVDRIQNRNNGHADGLFSHNAKVENNTFNSISGATALKLDEKFEINNEEEQKSIVDDLDVKTPELKSDSDFNGLNLEKEIPTGVSIESASYIESNSDNMPEIETKDEEFTPKLFSDDNQIEDEKNLNEPEGIYADQLFNQDSNEEEDFEIPAFLRKQKF